jgi:hypothetical protein
MYIARTKKSDDTATNPGWNLSDGSVDAAKRRLHDVATAAHARGADARYTFAVTKTAYARIDADPAHTAQILAVAEKMLDALVPSIAFAKAASNGVAQVVAPDPFWTSTFDPSTGVTTHRFALDAWLAACAAAGDGRIGSVFPR